MIKLQSGLVGASWGVSGLVAVGIHEESSKIIMLRRDRRNMSIPEPPLESYKNRGFWILTASIHNSISQNLQQKRKKAHTWKHTLPSTFGVQNLQPLNKIIIIPDPSQLGSNFLPSIWQLQALQGSGGKANLTTGLDFMIWCPKIGLPQIIQKVIRPLVHSIETHGFGVATF
jgi:hypothetical protein